MLQLHRATGLSITAALFSAFWVAVPLLHGWGVYLGTVGFFGEPIVWLGYLTVTVGAIGWFVVGLFLGTWRRIVPLLIVGVAFVIQQSADLEATATRWNFRHRFEQRKEVVRLIERGEIVATRDAIAMSRAVDLPEPYRELSAGGYILIARHADGFSVTFYVKRVGMFDDDDYTAFVYRSGAGQPTTEVEDTDRFYDVEAWQPHWFFVKHT